MSNTDPTPACGILYVDDEEKALKYFRLAFSSKFTVFTAGSGSEGIELLRRESAKIGLVISDQRMPGMLGAEFLGMVRQEFPYVVRILTTAYSDLESAIQAVNTGHIYQYVVKPWEIDDLAMVLQRAADYFNVLSERNELLALKMTILQRVICSDRVKWLLLSSRTLDLTAQQAFRGAIAALVKGLPEDLRPSAADAGTFSRQQFEITRLVRDEYRNASHCLETMNVFKNGVGKDGDALKKALASFISLLAPACGFAATEVVFDYDGSSDEATLRLPACEPKKLASALFGLLVESECADVSVRFFESLLALAAIRATLTIQPDNAAPLVFAPVAEADANAVIDELYEKFSSSDISRL
jgi:two-component system probable response regulator PhcQ